MINANELRIGNWLMRKSQPDGFMVDALTISRFVYSGVRDEKPIPLTEDWLLGFGFIKNDPTFEGNYLPYWVKECVCLFYNSSPPENTYLSGYGIAKYGQEPMYYAATFKWIDSVHQLQNLYFALTGQELKIAQTQNAS